MNRRSFFRVATVICALGAGLAGAQGPAAADALEVGGGASGIEIVARAEHPAFDTIEQYRSGAALAVVTPRVVLPKFGSATLRTRSALNFSEGSVRATALKVTTIGNLQGDPYAESSASVVGLKIPGVPFTAARSDCRWDEANGITGSTVLVRAGSGEEYAPEPNTVMEIPGGFVVLNEQEIHTERINSTQTREVIWVKAIRVFLDNQDQELPDNGYGSLDISVSFSSCDPVKIPPVSGLGFTGNSS